jgi:glycosyltransferase involved in cell wall biosynthesis
LPFGSTDVDAFLAGIDFFVYFTHPALRESFGRVLAEAIAAGKLVITDPGTAETFGPAVVASDGQDVDRLIRGFVADPARYQAFVQDAQARLAAFSAESFRSTVQGLLAEPTLAGDAA